MILTLSSSGQTQSFFILKVLLFLLFVISLIKIKNFVAKNMEKKTPSFCENKHLLILKMRKVK